MQSTPVVGPITEAQAMKAIATPIVVESTSASSVEAEPVSFEISKAEEMPVVMENHFESSATRKEGESLVKNSVNSTYGVVNNFMYQFFAKK